MHMRRLTDSLVQPTRVRVLISAVVVEDAACDDAEVFGEVERRGDDEQAEEEEEYGIYCARVSWVCGVNRVVVRLGIGVYGRVDAVQGEATY